MCKREYTAATVAEMQRIAALVEIRQWAQSIKQEIEGSTDDYDVGELSIVRSLLILLDQIEARCDNPPEPPTVADYTEGMV